MRVWCAYWMDDGPGWECAKTNSTYHPRLSKERQTICMLPKFLTWVRSSLKSTYHPPLGEEHQIICILSKSLTKIKSSFKYAYYLCLDKERQVKRILSKALDFDKEYFTSSKCICASWNFGDEWKILLSLGMHGWKRKTRMVQHNKIKRIVPKLSCQRATTFQVKRKNTNNNQQREKWNKFKLEHTRLTEATEGSMERWKGKSFLVESLWLCFICAHWSNC